MEMIFQGSLTLWLGRWLAQDCPKIYNNGRLTAIAGLESLQNLREVALDERFIVTSIDKLSNLNRLQRLKLKNSHSFA